jgi:hypothetical protein
MPHVRARTCTVPRSATPPRVTLPRTRRAPWSRVHPTEVRCLFVCVTCLASGAPAAHGAARCTPHVQVETVREHPFPRFKTVLTYTQIPLSPAVSHQIPHVVGITLKPRRNPRVAQRQRNSGTPAAVEVRASKLGRPAIGREHASTLCLRLCVPEGRSRDIA